MRTTWARRIGTPLLGVGLVMLVAQVAAFSAGYGWHVIPTGVVVDPIVRLIHLDSALETRSMRGIGVLVGWLSRSHLYLICLVSGLFMTSLDAGLSE